ncbi:transposase [Streptomyces sp. NPDC090032]|uniref:transposase n=1 Tax=unclassified Streptomyces TaxID=2593676 RepID=UPI0037152F23
MDTCQFDLVGLGREAQARRPSKCLGKFRRDAVALYRDWGGHRTAVAKETGVNPDTLRNWVRAAEVERGPIHTTKWTKARTAAARHR